MQVGVSNQICQLVAEAHTSTWFSTQGLDEPCTTQIGSKPGDPLIFNFLSVKILNEVEQVADERGLVMTLPGLPDNLDVTFHENCRGLQLSEDNYVDDSTFFQVAVCPFDLIARIYQLAAIESHCLRLNFKSNKTEALICLRGTRSRAAMRDLVLLKDSVLALPHPVKDGTVLRFVHSYKHRVP